jgi:hypothetical protein
MNDKCLLLEINLFSTLVGNRKISAKLFVPGLSYAKYAYELEAIISPNGFNDIVTEKLQ